MFGLLIVEFDLVFLSVTKSEGFFDMSPCILACAKSSGYVKKVLKVAAMIEAKIVLPKFYSK